MWLSVCLAPGLQFALLYRLHMALGAHLFIGEAGKQSLLILATLPVQSCPPPLPVAVPLPLSNGPEQLSRLRVPNIRHSCCLVLTQFGSERVAIGETGLDCPFCLSTGFGPFCAFWANGSCRYGVPLGA